MDFIAIILIFNLVICVLGDYSLKIQHNGPVLRGGTIVFSAELLDDNKPASGSFKYDWEDTIQPSNGASHDSKLHTDTFTVEYRKRYRPGSFKMRLDVAKYYAFVPIHKISGEIDFQITESLTGDFAIRQNNVTVTSQYVSTLSTANQEIVISEANLKYINKTATSVNTYWFVDCELYAVTQNYSLDMNYSVANKELLLDAVTIISYDPITTPAPPTTTSTTTTTVKPPVTTTATTTVKPNVTTTVTPTPKSVATNVSSSGNISVVSVSNNSISKREAIPVSQPSQITPVNNATTNKNVTIVDKGVYTVINKTHRGPIRIDKDFPFICATKTFTGLEKNESHGYYSRKIVTKEPVRNISVTGTDWVRHGDLLSLSITCQGSYNFNYCVHYHPGDYNVTANETCMVFDTSERCRFPIRRYFSQPGTHTVVIVVFNDVGKAVSPVKVTVYKDTKNAQLSVIVVPVSFSLVAIVLIIFGVAYYFQNRSRFIVEVADFNFGAQYNDMEYKTFKERLKDSFSNACTRVPISKSSSAADVDVWPNNRKYGSMT